MIGGVAGGLAEYFNIDVSLVRLLWILSLFLVGGGILAILLLGSLFPKKDLYKV